MSETSSGSIENDGFAALSLLEEAIQLLDRLDTQVEIAGHVQLAIDRLRGVLGAGPPSQNATLDE